jgi:hypothetical protein
MLLQSAVVFQSFGIACRAISGDQASQKVLTYEQVCIAGALSCLHVVAACNAGSSMLLSFAECPPLSQYAPAYCSIQEGQSTA